MKMETIKEKVLQIASKIFNVDKSVLTEETNLHTLSILSLFLIDHNNYGKNKNLVVSKEGIKSNITQQLETIKEMLGKEDRRVRLDISELFEGNEVVFYHDKLRSDIQYDFTLRTRLFIDDIQNTFEVELLGQNYGRYLTLGDILHSLEKSLENKNTEYRINKEVTRLLEVLSQDDSEQLKDTCKKLNLHEISQMLRPSDEERRKEIEFMQLIRDIFSKDYGENPDGDIVFQIYEAIKWNSKWYV